MKLNLLFIKNLHLQFLRSFILKERDQLHVASGDVQRWFSIARGLAVCLVVFVHVYGDDTLLAQINGVYLLPLFFFVAGYTFKPNPALKKYLLKKTQHVLVPCFSFTIIFLFLETVRTLAFGQNRAEEMVSFLMNVHDKQSHFGKLTLTFWFVPVLFATQQVTNFILIKCRKAWHAAIHLAMLALAYINSLWMPDIIWPLYLNIILISSPIFYIGYCWGRILYSRFAFVNYIVSGGIIVLVLQGLPLLCNMKNINYGIPVLSLFGGISMTCVFLQLCSGLLRWGRIVRICTALGNASLVIMLIHGAFIILFLNHISSCFVLGTLCIASSYAVYIFLKKFEFSQRFFLGIIVPHRKSLAD